jgi:hypothetical protein
VQVCADKTGSSVCKLYLGGLKVTRGNPARRKSSLQHEGKMAGETIRTLYRQMDEEHEGEPPSPPLAGLSNSGGPRSPLCSQEVLSSLVRHLTVKPEQRF